MKQSKLLTEISLVIVLFLSSCDKENPVIHSDCKTFDLKSTAYSDGYGSDSSCVIYNYSFQDKKLNLRHVNAAFNCCPEEIYCDINTRNDTIFLKEREKKADCDCNCLYDLDITVSGINKQKYTINIYEPYCRDQESILFEIDLTQSETGVFCLMRTLYPWGI